ncbi:hypothetical protein PUNSTDRAFT_138722 [Punctularia strigosozonata HHB-11173 SS5]|uniref:Uncharacterized protein n=1 Tax=Punctularia strigosozonata (strain HHB-11173) TaxID=741275 RepID=R7S2A4_PUNST|nr:uncharacterized protein PUNSTDRAFT_138722 [Punctularia strigosozonata HHB-11173 SS5]EIN04328.1 hypothetical protein PUNSTDRAFT_138722 [Punctularia strigosozonata HHB-11173 SS5]
MIYTVAVPTFYDEPKSGDHSTHGSRRSSAAPDSPGDGDDNSGGAAAAPMPELATAILPSTNDGRARIPKPAGEAGRPDRGGYSLRTALRSDPSLYPQLLKLARDLVTKHLSPSICYSAQSKRALAEAISDGSSQLPLLNEFQDCWPLVDALRMRLKEYLRNELSLRVNDS